MPDTDLAAFIRARLDEDEQEALAASPGPWRANAEHDEVLAVDGETVADGFALSSEQLRATVRHIVRHDPARVLREIEAKRHLLHAHAREHECLGLTGHGEHSVVDGKPWEFWENHYTDDLGPCFVLRCLALPYADHESFREEWRP
ncbi:DUF6221 family protein [Nonomuraea sp. NPDC049655]|uniref:DUF6221 family protein n=1 Tax=Nonomuraea sp. NPDC049655 TaxID=3364355 RepID=UPI0037A063B9